MIQLKQWYWRLLWAGILLLPSHLFGQLTSGNYVYEQTGDSIRLIQYTGVEAVVVIPETIDGLPVASIGNGAFELNTILAQVTLPSHLTNIEDLAFYYCTSLSSISIPDGVVSIGNSTFSFCSSLGSVAIPGSVMTIGNSAFSQCSRMSSLTLSNGLASIGDHAFLGCSVLGSVKLPASVTNIGSGAFASCVSLAALTVDEQNGCFTSIDGSLFDKTGTTLIQFPGASTGEYAMPGGAANIGREAFYGCANVSSIIIPEGVTNIGVGAFEHCTVLTNISISKTVVSIGDVAFGYCYSLPSLHFSASVNSIGLDPFYACFALTNISVDVENGLYSSRDGVLFDKLQTTLIQFPGGNATAYRIPDGVTRIAPWGFNNCSVLNVTIPAGVRQIERNTFISCYNLTNVTMPSGIQSVADYGFYDCRKLVGLQISDTITNVGNYAFGQCPVLTNLVFTGHLNYVGMMAFAGSGLQNLLFAGGVDVFGQGALDNAKLKRVFINGDAPKATSDVLRSAISSTLYYITGNKGWSKTYAGRPTLGFSGTYTNFYIYQTDGANASINVYLGFDTTVSIPESLNGFQSKTINFGAFQKLTQIQALTMPNTVAIIGSNAFSGCTSLKSVTLSTNLVYIGSAAFSNCTALTTISIPNGVYSIQDWTFALCSSLTNVVIPDSVNTLGDNAFYGCFQLPFVRLPAGLAQIGQSAFYNCSSLKSIFFTGPPPASVANTAFNYTYGATVYYPSGVTGWSNTYAQHTALQWPAVVAQRTADQVVLSWPMGTLLESTDPVNGPWTATPSAQSPFIPPASAAQKFYRLKLY